MSQDSVCRDWFSDDDLDERCTLHCAAMGIPSCNLWRLSSGGPA